MYGEFVVRGAEPVMAPVEPDDFLDGLALDSFRQAKRDLWRRQRERVVLGERLGVSGRATVSDTYRAPKFQERVMMAQGR